MSQKYSVLLIGAGSMGGSMLSGWLNEGLLDLSRSAVVDPQIDKTLYHRLEECGLTLNPENEQPWDICVLAIKPQMFPAILPTLAWPEMNKTLFVSVAAGKSIKTIRTHLKQTGADAADIIRAMPNLPVSVGKGVTLLFAENSVSKARRAVVDNLMSASGTAVWLDSETAIDTGMSVSACGPAYVFLLAEAMAEAGVAAGLSADCAEILARETVVGAAALMANSQHGAALLRKNVTSPGGTTEQALQVLDSREGFRPLLTKAVQAATARAKELSN